MKLGVISDTHGLLRPEVLSALDGCEAILHGGDINRQEIIDTLETIAPVYVVRGNNDKEWAERIPAFLDFELSGLRIYMTHKKKDLPRNLTPYGLVIFGHSHKYEESFLGGTLLLNPGSCGPRRFHQTITMAIVEVQTGKPAAMRIDIPHPDAGSKPKASVPDLKRQIEIVMRETEKGRTTLQIAERYGITPTLTEQIARLYVTHPGVTADGIMSKMGL